MGMRMRWEEEVEGREKTKNCERNIELNILILLLNSHSKNSKIAKIFKIYENCIKWQKNLKKKSSS